MKRIWVEVLTDDPDVVDVLDACATAEGLAREAGLHITSGPNWTRRDGAWGYEWDVESQ